MLQKKKYITPTTRFASVVNIFDNQTPFLKFFEKKKTPTNQSRKIFWKKKNVQPSHSMRLNLAAIVTGYSYNKKPYQLLLNTKSFFGNTIILPGIDLVLPGQKVFDLTKNCFFKKIVYLGSQITLEQLPYHLFVSCINNNYNNKKTFARSSGTSGMKLKGKKTVKLVLIKLPSLRVYFFLKTTKCFIGKNSNFFNNKFIEGKWGFSIHKTKQLMVRGVAMNPVDHPNGGRTKSKQPEKSPWGWIAKKSK